MSVRMKSQAGFSLIELMIVVAIIGILATVAAPNFKRFMAQSKQGEAKQNLAAYYQAQRAFFDQWQVYPGQFSAAGYRPEGQINYRITAANNAGGIADIVANSNYMGTAANGGDIAACITTGVAASGCFPMDPNNGQAGFGWRESDMARSSVPAGCVAAVAGTPATQSTFLACASALHSGAPAHDTWSITHNKDIRNATVGIP